MKIYSQIQNYWRKKMIKTIEDLKNISSFNKEYFSEAIKIFFNDIDYQILESKQQKSI